MEGFSREGEEGRKGEEGENKLIIGWGGGRGMGEGEEAHTTTRRNTLEKTSAGELQSRLNIAEVHDLLCFGFFDHMRL